MTIFSLKFFKKINSLSTANIVVVVAKFFIKETAKADNRSLLTLHPW